jgi:hypothetical protein
MTSMPVKVLQIFKGASNRMLEGKCMKNAAFVKSLSEELITLLLG